MSAKNMPNIWKQYSRNTTRSKPTGQEQDMSEFTWHAGLCQRASPLVHAWVCPQGTATISTRPTQETEPTLYPHTPIKYGAKKQYAKQESTAPPATPQQEKKFIQQVAGKFLFYGRAVDSTVLMPIRAIASQSAKNPTKETLQHTKQCLKAY